MASNVPYVKVAQSAFDDPFLYTCRKKKKTKSFLINWFHFESTCFFGSQILLFRLSYMLAHVLNLHFTSKSPLF